MASITFGTERTAPSKTKDRMSSVS